MEMDSTLNLSVMASLKEGIYDGTNSCGQDYDGNVIVS